MKALLTAILGLLAGTAPTQAEDTLSLNLPQADIREVLSLYEQLTGFHVVKSNMVVGTVSAQANGRVSKKTAIELIEAALFASGFPMVQTEPDMVEVVGVGGMVAARPMPTLTRLEDLPTHERVVRYVYQLKTRKPKDVLAILQRTLTPSYLMLPLVTADEPTRTLIIVERASTLRGLLKLIAELDQPPAK
jgi:type II secretory pathway component GspD/PulD (secretin)